MTSVSAHLTPPLLLLSGLLCDASIWDAQRAALADIAEVQVLDFPGIDSVQQMAAQALAAAPDQFALAGHSMGGRVALEIVRQAPERVQRLALLDTACIRRTRRSMRSVVRWWSLRTVPACRCWPGSGCRRCCTPTATTMPN